MPLTHVFFDEIESTHLYIGKLHDPEVIVVADYQTGGRGQEGNGWESERGKNLLFSLRTQVEGLEVKDRFVLSMAGALALKDVLDKYCDDITLKWPNDIYWQDKKISGTLIVTSISGRKVKDCVYSAGLNLNQKKFESDAPNPVSLCQIIGHEVDRNTILEEVVDAFECRKQQIAKDGLEEIKMCYGNSMYRKEGYWPFEDAKGVFKARIRGVSQEGYLSLEDETGKGRTYEIKQLKYII